MRQLKSVKASIPLEMHGFINSVSRTYRNYDKMLAERQTLVPEEQNELLSLNLKLMDDIFRCERTHQQLENLNNEFSILFENIDDVLFSFDPSNKRLIQISAACEKIYGFSPQEFYINPYLWQTQIHPDDKKRVKAAFLAVKRGKKNRLHYRIYNRNGEVRWLESKFIPTWDEHGKLIRVDGITSDNTEQIKNEQKIRENELRAIESEKMYRVIFDNNPMPMWIIDPKTFGFLAVNNAAVREYGFSKEEFLSMTVYNIKSENEKGKLKSYIKNNGLSVKNFVTRHVKKNGEEITVEITGESVEFSGKSGIIILANNISEKLRAERDLKQSNERYELVTKATSDTIWDWNFKTNEFYRSEVYKSMSGYECDSERHCEIWKKRIHPDDVERVQKKLDLVIKGATSDYWEDEYRFIKADGSIAYIYDRGFVIYDEQGNPLRMVGAMQDITKRKKAEEKLQKSEANFRNILENTETGYVLLDNAGRILSFNSASSSMLPYNSLNDFKEGVLYQSLVPKKRQQEIQSAVNVVLTTGQRVEYEVLMDSPDENGKWIYVCMNPIISNNVILGLSIATTDITRRKYSEQLLRKSEANLRTIFDNTEVSYVLLDKALRVVSYNSSAEIGFKRFNWSPLKEGADVIQLLPADSRLLARSRYDLVLQGKKMSYEREVTLPNGGIAWYSVRAFPVYDELNNILGMIVSAEDISSRKFADLEKEKITEDLMQRNTTLEQFAYIISHNLRSPVANITGLSNLILSNQLSKTDFERCMKGLALSVSRLDEIIIDLNHILQVRRGINEKKEHVKFSSIVKDIRASIGSLADDENIIIKTNFMAANDLFTVKTYLNSIFYNLISNSIKYRKPSCEAVIEISSQMIGDDVVLTFKDNGIGFDMSATRDKLFGLYRKFHNHIEGKGMGLFMVKTQTEILGGKITVKSEPDRGTEFTITLKAEGALVMA